MSSPKTARTTRRILKLASLGIAGLIVGLLSGCSSSPNPGNLATYTQPSSLEFNAFTRVHQPGSLFNNHPLPDIKHPPAPHRIESWADRTPRQASPFSSSQINADPTLTNYAFTGVSGPSSSGTGHLTVQ